ncbi:MAG TPA: multicopper oxidase family protein [Blastocatellia bacterium]|nr:multicopper oxidase family protein [Blastocatellia bacterium]
MTRRKVLKIGMAAGAATVLAPTILTSRKASAFQEVTPPPEPTLCGATAPASPATTPFLDDLAIPPQAAPTILSPAPIKSANLDGGEAARDDHQRWEEFLPQLQYQLEARAGLHSFHSELQPSYIWGFDGSYPGATIPGTYGQPMIVRFKNGLPATTSSFGKNELTVHLHNGHTGSESDGFAGDFFGTGLWKDNHYVNAYAGIDAFGGIGDPNEAMHTFWYHDHRAGFTANNNYLGLNGMFFMYNETDPGHEDDTPGSLRLPGLYGVTDIPLLLTDKRFCAAASGRNELFQVVGNGAPGGDKWIVNGKIQPKLNVTRRKYRFRILNTGAAKAWNLSLIKPDGTNGTLTVVTTDSNLLASPVDVTTLQLNVAERFDVIIDFSAFAVGDKVYLREAAAQNVGVAAPETLPSGLAIGNVVMRFDVAGEAVIPDTPPIPSTLATYPTLPDPTATKEWTFKLVGGRFLVNDLEFDANRVDHVVLKGTTEEWSLRNDVIAGNWVHPVHIHFEEFRIMERTNANGNVALSALEQGRKDVVTLPGQTSAKIRMQFRDFVGRYLIHCHNTNHEDAFMMVRWDIVETAAQLAQRKQEIAERRRQAGLPAEKEVAS